MTKIKYVGEDERRIKVGKVFLEPGATVSPVPGEADHYCDSASIAHLLRRSDFEPLTKKTTKAAKPAEDLNDG